MNKRTNLSSASSSRAALNKTEASKTNSSSSKQFNRTGSATMSKTTSVPDMKRGRPKTKEEKSKKKIESK